MRQIIIVLAILTSCVNPTVEPPVGSLSLQEIGQKLNGYWRPIEVEKIDGKRETDFDPDKLDFYEFEGLEGAMGKMTDRHDGTFIVRSCQPWCELKEAGPRKLIKYIGMSGSRDREILKITSSELVLADSTTTWRYERAIINY